MGEGSFEDFVLIDLLGETGHLSSNTLPHRKDIRFSPLPEEHNKRLRLPHLSHRILLPLLLFHIHQHRQRPQTRPLNLLPLRINLRNPAEPPPPSRRPNPQRPLLQHPRLPPTPPSNNIPANSRRLLCFPHSQNPIPIQILVQSRQTSRSQDNSTSQHRPPLSPTPLPNTSTPRPSHRSHLPRRAGNRLEITRDRMVGSVRRRSRGIGILSRSVGECGGCGREGS